MRRLSDRARLEGMLALRKALESVRRGPGSALAVSGDALRESLAEQRAAEATTWLARTEVTRDEHGISETFLTDDDGWDISKALDRIADSIDRIGAQLDSYHLERAEHLDAIEFLLREMVIGTVEPTAARSAALGGVVDPSTLASDPSRRSDDQGITIIPDGYPLGVDTQVEVRSRFHDRWISGFSIAEAVDTPGRCRYRLTRRSDGIPLPILFDACDVRPASNSFDRQPASTGRASVSDLRPGN